MSVWFGLHLPSYTFPDTPPRQLFDRIVEQARTAEEHGFGLVTVMDHLYQIGGVGSVDEPMLEGWMTLAAIARETSRVRLGTLVTGVTYRNPALLAKEATTLDTISGGRAILGIGAAWNDVEHEGYGFDFPPVGQRMDRLEEALAIIHGMFTEDRRRVPPDRGLQRGGLIIELLESRGIVGRPDEIKAHLGIFFQQAGNFIAAGLANRRRAEPGCSNGIGLG